jgi:hypothetical protein
MLTITALLLAAIAASQEVANQSATSSAQLTNDSQPAVASHAASATDPAASDAAASTAPAAASVAPPTPQSEIKLDSSAAPTRPDDIKIETLADGTIVIPAGRPEWVSARKSDFSDPEVHRIYVTSGPYKLPQDAQRGLDDALKQATDQYVADQLRSPLAAKFISHDPQTIRDRFVKQTYRETVNFADPIGPMQQLHAQLEFDSAFRKQIHQHWVGRIAESRLYQIGLGAGAVLLLLTSVFGYFRLDNATRGYYSGRLQFLTAAAILAIVALASAAAFQFTWL